MATTAYLCAQQIKDGVVDMGGPDGCLEEGQEEAFVALCEAHERTDIRYAPVTIVGYYFFPIALSSVNLIVLLIRIHLQCGQNVKPRQANPGGGVDTRFGYPGSITYLGCCSAA
jgi:hypothetical protein